MMLLIISDLKSKTRDYKPFFQTIKDSSQRWWHYLTSTWVVVTDHSPDDFFKLLQAHIDTKGDDRIFIVQIKKNYQGWLPQDAWDWINKQSFN